MTLDPHARELELLGFRIARQDAGEVFAVMKRWHWDCVFTRVTYVVVVRRVDRLTAGMLDEDRQRLPAVAKELDDSALPRGFQKGVAVLPAYVADVVEDDARERLERKSGVRFAWFWFPGARDRASGESLYLRRTAVWGALYYSKFRALMDRLLEPTGRPGALPVSLPGAVLTTFTIALIVVSLAVILSS